MGKNSEIVSMLQAFRLACIMHFRRKPSCFQAVYFLHTEWEK